MFPRKTRSLWTFATCARKLSLQDSIQASHDKMATWLQNVGKHPLPEPPIHNLQDTVCIVLVSPHYSHNDLFKTTEYVTSSTGIPPERILGAVVDRLGHHAGGRGVSLGFLHQKQANAVISSSLFHVDSKDLWKSREKRVGRWHEANAIPTSQPGLGRVLGGLLKDRSPQELLEYQPLAHSCLDKMKRELTKPPSFILGFSDKEPYQLLHSFNTTFPQTPVMGLVGTMTPFITGLSYSLFYGNQIKEGGFVGLGVHLNDPFITETHDDAIHFFGEEFEITSCRGNIILSLDGSNAARHLLREISEYQLDGKDDVDMSEGDRQLYLKCWKYDAGKRDGSATVCKISSGDPSKGLLSLDCAIDLEQGSHVQFGYLKKKDILFTRKKPGFKTFLSASVTPGLEAYINQQARDQQEWQDWNNDEDLSGVYISRCLEASSEGGYLVSRTDGSSRVESRVCDIPASLLTATF